MNIVYTPTPDEREFAQGWHGGLATVLYAIASTGVLAHGTIRPNFTDEALIHTPMTDDEWSLHLVGRLHRELFDLAQYVESDHDRKVRNEWVDNLVALADTLEAKIAAAAQGELVDSLLANAE